ncbi:S8 family serine peptidase [Microbispora hainanensis]|uniref:S8 family serine peptidase n=1 Tax=Microbispora hainanensis TaxID=568844 RepID=UPI002E294568|nr:S8 family serine peptidase [Microbispora hainanensis]
MASSWGELDSHQGVEVLTTGGAYSLLTTANATSAATSQAARLGALVLSRYPSLTPEAVRGLLVHAAEWTPAMAAHFPTPREGSLKSKRYALLKRYGWGAPTEARVLASAAGDVTMIVEDEFRPFARSKSSISMRAMRLHTLPWPSDLLQDLENAPVRMRVTLSYFIEPNPSNRGWQGRYAYASHGLRFDVIRPTESLADFHKRLSNAAEGEERGVRTTSATDDRWFLGQARNSGSLHADIWSGHAVDLARCGVIAVYPVGGWWKQNNRRDRVSVPVRYALLVSLFTEVQADIHTPIASKIQVPVQIDT